MTEQAQCRSCGAPIIWIRHGTTGSLLPLDAAPVDNGNMQIVDDKAVNIGGLFEPVADAPKYVNHFSTCPDSKRWKKKK